ncbi:MarR family transcriptional regulator [Deinococcus sp. Arct2-2]|uniref:MarR family winged helix-turn-helix transcriptional regulator n=1 Tax=Deinococcus sp. Arct2-2 TaxID=2568653 RepID=UPI0010A52177|nr:MarR family transcriptional regulator [Deinococcus sp. Arct2-2]THF68386.1 MarR family transcriptional regulator [Deinococcus sp. Arct2-2]
MNKVAEQLNRQVEGVIAPHQLTVAQYGLLLLLQTRGPQAQIVLSQQVGLDRTAVMRTVDLLESRGLVRRDADAIDRRKNSVALTDAGTELLTQTLPDVRQAEQAVTARLSSHEQGLLMALLRRLLSSP